MIWKNYCKTCYKLAVTYYFYLFEIIENLRNYIFNTLLTKYVTTPTYAPHCNPVEKTNRTIKTMISQFVEKDQRMWDEKLATLQFAFNTAVHDATGYTPAYLNLGRELISPINDPNESASAPNIRKLQEAVFMD